MGGDILITAFFVLILSFFLVIGSEVVVENYTAVVFLAHGATDLGCGYHESIVHSMVCFPLCVYPWRKTSRSACVLGNEDA